MERSYYMNSESNYPTQQNVSRQIQVQLVDGSRITCRSEDDAQLVLDADRRHYEGNTGRKLPRRTLAALERAGLTASNSMLYRSAMDKLAED
jgi:hypothetical protein